MRKLAILFVVLGLVVLPAFAQEAAKKVDITGAWEMTVETPQGSMTLTANYKQEGEALTGTHVSEMGEAPLKGTVKGLDVNYTITLDMQGQQFAIAHVGKLDEAGETIAGTADMGGMGTMTWSAKRKK